MVSYKKVRQHDENEDSNVLFEAPSRVLDGDIELGNINTSREQLLSSFERESFDEEFLTPDEDEEADLDEDNAASKTSTDDRVFFHHEENEIHRSIQNNITMEGNTNNINNNNNSNLVTAGNNPTMRHVTNGTELEGNNDASLTSGVNANSASGNVNAPTVTGCSSSGSPGGVSSSVSRSAQALSSGSIASRIPVAINSIRNQFNFLDRLFPKKYTPGERMGEGSENDGVFSNLSAKPDLSTELECDKPPTYEEAAADSTPPYWENSVQAPGFGEEVFIDGLPVGNIINFAWNLLVSASFQFIGFLLTYILHTSHAAKHGSRAGLGVTFITYGYNLIPHTKSYDNNNKKIANSKIEPTDANNYNIDTDNKIEGSLDNYHSSLSSGTDPVVEDESSTFMVWLAYGVILFGLLIIVKAFLNYRRAKKMEDTILQPPPDDVIPPENQV